MRTANLPAILIFGLAFSPSPGLGEIYKWTDEQGRMHYSDKPPARGPASEVQVKINTYTSPRITASPFTGKNRTTTSSNQVILYSTSWCGYCKKARNYFQANNIPFTEYDVETSEKGKRDYQAMNGNGVPIILVGAKRLNGFSPTSFERLYDE